MILLHKKCLIVSSLLVHKDEDESCMRASEMLLTKNIPIEEWQELQADCCKKLVDGHKKC